MIQYLIEHGANIYDFMKQHGYKYLIRACEEQDETYIKYLVKYGTDINKKRVTHTKINGIKDKYKFNIYEFYEDEYYKDESDEDEFDDCSENESDKYDDNSEEDDKKILSTPLIITCKYGNLDFVKYLIEHGANVNEVMKDGNTALIVACRFMRRKYNNTIIKYLIEYGANVNKKGWQYMKSEPYNKTRFIEATPLIIACLYEDKSLVQYLVEHEANVNKKITVKEYSKENITTALTIAFRFKNWDIMKYLVEHGANVKEKNIL